MDDEILSGDRGRSGGPDLRVLVVGSQLLYEQSAVWDAACELGVEIVMLGPDDVPGIECYPLSRRRPELAEAIVRDPRVLVRRPGNLWWTFPGLAEIVEEVRPDVIHVTSEVWGLLVHQALRCGVPVTVQGADNQFLFGSGPERWLRVASLRYTLGRIAGYASWNSRGTDLARRFGLSSKASTLISPPMTPRPCDVPSRDWHDSRLQVVYVGRLERQKGIEDLASALSMMAKSDQIRLHVVGSGSCASALDSSPHGVVVQHGTMSNEEAVAQMGRCHLTVIPSRTEPLWAEQFGRVAVESMAVGTPVVATSTGALPEVVGDAGVLVDERRPDELARVLDHLVADRDELVSLAQAARKRYIDHYTPTGLAWKLQRFWLDATQERA